MHKKTCLFDSSTWISYALGIEKDRETTNKIMKLIEKDSIILLPEIIYAEVKNVLHRMLFDTIKEQKLEYTFRRKNIKKFCSKEIFWFKKFDFYTKKIKLHTHDLIILAYTQEYNVDIFLTGDKKLLAAYEQFNPKTI